MCDSRIFIDVPVRKSYVQLLSKELPETRLVSMESDVGLVLLSLLTKDYHNNDVLYSEGYVPFEVKLPHRYQFKRGTFISEVQALFFNKYLDRLMKRVFISEVDRMRLLYRMKRKDAIEAFRNEYAIHADELSYESQKKNYYRTELKRNPLKMSA